MDKPLVNMAKLLVLFSYSFRSSFCCGNGRKLIADVVGHVEAPCIACTPVTAVLFSGDV